MNKHKMAGEVTFLPLNKLKPPNPEYPNNKAGSVLTSNFVIKLLSDCSSLLSLLSLFLLSYSLTLLPFLPPLSSRILSLSPRLALYPALPLSVHSFFHFPS